MIPKNVIELAIEGGYHSTAYAVAEDIPYEKWTPAEHAEVALDSSFWCALGKSLGWDDSSGGKYAHELLDLLLTHQDPTEFWQNIIQSKK